MNVKFCGMNVIICKFPGSALSDGGRIFGKLRLIEEPALYTDYSGKELTQTLTVQVSLQLKK